MFKLLNCLKYLSLKTATSLLQLLIISIVIGLCLIVLAVNRIMMDALISEISDKLLFKQNFQQYELQTEMLKYQVNWPMIQRFQMMNSFSKIYQNFMPQVQIQNFNYPMECPIYKGQLHEQYSTLFQLPEFCISYKNQTRKIDNRQFYPFLNFLNQLIIPFTYTPISELYMTNTDENYLFASNPPIFDYPSYNPQVRPWYINHMEQSQNSNSQGFVSYVYKSYGNNQYSFTITYSLFENNPSNKNQRGDLQAVMGYDLSFNQYADHLRFQQFVFLITNLLGQIICTNSIEDIRLDQEIYYVYQQNLTGFTEKDWQQMQYSAQRQPYINNCTLQINHLCRFNTKYQEDIILHVLNLKSDFYLIIFQNVTIQKENIEMAEKTKMEIIQAFAKNISYLVGASMALLICSWIGMYLFFRPIKQMREKMDTLIRNKFSSHNWMQKIQNEFDEKNTNYLKQALKNLKSKITNIKRKKCLNCYLIENFKYPQRVLTIDFYQIKNLIKKMPQDQIIEEQISQKEIKIDNIIKSPENTNIIPQIITNKLYSQSLNSEIDENVQLINSMDRIF
ncbi:unnamed protein product [Paramecium primaurelia]|uniref:Transmembrane protein n=1 Tax=Paramecium primaurelia TaxID=5886 RepID=A0A8S1L4Y8_PARPR|nr:unnamed protein product [Paramecium primaurelia]